MGKQDEKGKAAGGKAEAETGVEGLVETVLRQDEERGEWEIVSVALPGEVQRRMGVIQRLLAVEGTRRYGKVQAAAAEELGVTVRSVQRLVKRWREDGVAGLRTQARSDQGTIRISPEWQEFIVKTYRAGNRGSRTMSPAQVAVRVQVRAREQEEADYPSRATVYRVLKPYVEKQRRSKSLGWCRVSRFSSSISR